MQLLTKEILKKIPALYGQEDRGDNATAYVKYFDPCGSWTWYATEGSFVCPCHGMIDCTESPKEKWTEFMFFGLVKGEETELGYFSLVELQSARRPFGLTIERDLHFKPTTLGEIKKKLGAV